MKKTTKVRIHDDVRNINKELLIEILRYAGVLTVTKDDSVGTAINIDINFPQSNAVCMDVWAEQNTKRIRSFGIETSMVTLNR